MIAPRRGHLGNQVRGQGIIEEIGGEWCHGE
jgi:hypothetical protein